MYSRIFILFSLIYFGSCAPKLEVERIRSADQLTSYSLQEKIRHCNDQLNYAPDEWTTMKYIRINVHFVDDASGTKNFTKEEGKKFMWTLINNANKRLGDNQKMNLPVGNETPNLPTQYRYKIHPQPNDPEDDGFYVHYDDDLYYFINKGKYKNNYSRKVINKYNIGGDSIVNIFVLPHHPDSVKSKTYKPHGTGIALGSSLKMSGLYENQEKPWAFATLLNHEVGHILGLSHSWVTNDRCQDTPKHPNCWDSNGAPPCNGAHSNNMMDYNNSQMSITPCQLGIIHKGFNKLKHKNRKVVQEDWCTFDPDSEILIDREVEWLGARDINKTIVISKTGSLKIGCRLSMAEDSKIVVEPGGVLILEECLLHNDCGYQWEGIEVQKLGDKYGEVKAYGEVTIENTYID